MPEEPIILTFGGGINARRRTADVTLEECVPPSENFGLDPQFRALNRRPAFDLIATTPNAGTVDGFAQLIKQDGSVSTLVQSGLNVYSWDGDSTFALEGAIAFGAKMRGPREHNYTLDEFVIITDLAKKDVVKKWDGVTFVDFAHNLGGDLRAKYCRVYNERAFFANVQTAIDTPHILLGSAIGDAENLSTADRPSSSLGFDVSFFIPTPDLRPINGLEAAFGQFIVSTERGRLYRMTGSNAIDFAVQEFHVGSAVVGDEAIKNIGNDVVMGLAGRIESLSGTLNFGDVEANDLSLPISPLVDSTTSWVIEYDHRIQNVYCFPNDQAALYVLHKRVLNDPDSQGLSPWSKWTTAHNLGFQPNTVMQLVDPVSFEDVVYMGDDSGNIYKIAGTGGQDGGTSDIAVKRRSRQFAVPEGNIFDVNGWIHYRKLFQQLVTLRILGGGVAIYEQEISINIPATAETGAKIGFYNAESFYGDNETLYGVTFSDRISRQDWGAAGHASHFQIEVEISGAEPFDIEELGIAFSAAKT